MDGATGCLWNSGPSPGAGRRSFRRGARHRTAQNSRAGRRSSPLARAGNARVCRGMVQLAWGVLMFHEVATT
jgi:hypothetical protein